MVKIKRYETWTSNGTKWSHWFKFNGDFSEKWQIKNKLKNEYKEVSDEEWKKIQEEQDKEINQKMSLTI